MHIDVANPRKVTIVEHRGFDLDLAAAFRRCLEQVAFRADRRRDLGHEFFTDPVERRVRHLREQLFEIIVKQTRAVGQHGKRGVSPHRAGRFRARFGHWLKDDAQILVRVTECLLAHEQRVVIDRRDLRRFRQVVDRGIALFEPVRERMFIDVLLLQFLIVDDPALYRVDEENPARVQAFLDFDVFRRNVEHPDFRSHHHEVVFRHVVTRRAQAVAVEDGANHAAVRECDRGRPVPWLHEATVILVESAPVGAHRFVRAPRLGDHHEHGERQRTPGHVEEFEHLIETGGVRIAFEHDRKQLLQVVAEQIRFAQGFARAHPVRIAAQRVDFAVVGDIAERLGERP